jgi:putative transposase
MTQKSYKFRCYPTTDQAFQLRSEFGSARFVWNQALDYLDKKYTRTGKSSVNEYSKLLTSLKKTWKYSWLSEPPVTILIQKLRDLETARTNFFAGRARFPKRKRRDSKQSIRYQLDQRGVTNNYRAGELLKLPKLGELNVKWHRVPTGTPKMVTLSMDSCGDYYVSFSCEEEISHHPSSTKAVGVDWGLKSLITCSDGTVVSGKKATKKYAAKLKRAQQSLAKAKRGSMRRTFLKKIVAKIHRKIARVRKDELHNITSLLVRDNAIIAIEDLDIVQMKESRLAKGVSDSAFGMFKVMLQYKAEWYGRDLVQVDRWFPSSQLCSSCGTRHKILLSQRIMDCACGLVIDRDLNAAFNILNLGVAGSVNTK